MQRLNAWQKGKLTTRAISDNLPKAETKHLKKVLLSPSRPRKKMISSFILLDESKVQERKRIMVSANAQLLTDIQ
jgi:hypothetical protein